MSAAIKSVPILALLAAAGCGGGGSDQNVLITNHVPADADVEVLPPDESVATPTDELENGVADPNVNEALVNAG